MRKLLATAVLVAALAGSPTAVLATGHCDPAVEAERATVFAALAEQGVRIAGVTGAGGLAEFSSARERRERCDAVAARVAGVTGLGGVAVR